MDPLTEIQKELNRVACPNCRKSQFDLTLRCELAYKECLYTAACLSCGYTFDVSTEKTNLQKIDPDIERTLSDQKCHSCGRMGAELKFRCDLNQRTCLYVTACRHCSEISHRQENFAGEMT